jgi:hypothetical protein
MKKAMKQVSHAAGLVLWTLAGMFGADTAPTSWGEPVRKDIEKEEVE